MVHQACYNWCTIPLHVAHVDALSIVSHVGQGGEGWLPNLRLHTVWSAAFRVPICRPVLARVPRVKALAPQASQGWVALLPLLSPDYNSVLAAVVLGHSARAALHGG
jgi:hypothetical protein